MQVEVSVQQGEGLDPTIVGGDGSIADETWESWFTQWLATLSQSRDETPVALSAEQTYELSLRLTDDAEIQTLNAQYRHQDRPTDVLAFAALEVDAPQPFDLPDDYPLYLGDIVISVDTAKRQASQQGHPLMIELAWLASHGLLHLLGWDHPDDDSLERMLDQQRVLLQQVALDPPLEYDRVG